MVHHYFLKYLGKEAKIGHWLVIVHAVLIDKLIIDVISAISALDWLSLRCAAIITLRVSNPGLCPYARYFITLASSADRDVNVGPVGRN